MRVAAPLRIERRLRRTLRHVAAQEVVERLQRLALRACLLQGVQEGEALRVARVQRCGALVVAPPPGALPRRGVWLPRGAPAVRRRVEGLRWFPDRHESRVCCTPQRTLIPPPKHDSHNMWGEKRVVVPRNGTWHRRVACGVATALTSGHRAAEWGSHRQAAPRPRHCCPLRALARDGAPRACPLRSALHCACAPATRAPASTPPAHAAAARPR